MLAIGAAVIAWFMLLPRTRGDIFRVDEVHKISESYALRLVLEGRWDEFATSIDRSNGPFGKYAFGLAVLAAGEELPKEPLLARLPRKALTEPFVAYELAHPYLPLLTACRHLSLLATALAIGLVTFVAARTHSATAALIAFGWGAMHWLTPTFGGDAIYDPLLACLVFATLPLVLSRRFAPLAGVVCAMAFQTRLTGGIALAACLAVLLLDKRWKAAILVAVTFACAVFAMNPYYWPNPIGRFMHEISELRTTLAAVKADGVRLPLWAAETSARAPIAWTAFAKLRFTWIALGGGILLGAIAGCWFARKERSVLAWCAVVIIGILIWLPLPWARYFLVVLPPLALLAGIGYAGVVRRVFEAWR
ncbi:MAG TPA: hypothetical protein VGD79_03265 [Thermoanaerobaculia bacterium]